MARFRKILRSPSDRIFYLVDANFLVNKFIPSRLVTNTSEKLRVERAQEWWKEIDSQLKAGKAVVYIPDICIAESFKVLAKKYYVDKYFKTTVAHKKARDAMSLFLRTTSKSLKASRRDIRVHDISTCRDIIIAVDRFFESYLKAGLNVSVVDLLILATAKYLMDFYFIPKSSLFIVTQDNSLWRGSKSLTDIPTAFNPSMDSEIASKVFH